VNNNSYKRYRTARSPLLETLIQTVPGVYFAAPYEVGSKLGLPSKSVIEFCKLHKIPFMFDGSRYLILVDHRQGENLKGGKQHVLTEMKNLGNFSHQLTLWLSI